MSTMIFINNDMIQIVNVKGKKYQYESIPLKEGTILNGVMIDGEEVVQKLKEHQKKLNKATLVIDSSNVIVKKLQMPKLPKKKLLSIVKSEFNLGEDQEHVYDLNILESSQNEVSALGCAMPRDFIEKYQSLFKEANIKLKRVDVAINGIMKYVNNISELKGKTFILNIVFGNVLLSLLYEEGEYKISNRHRMINEMGSEAYVRELYDKFSVMVQFAQSQRIAEIKESYYVGIDEACMNSYVQSMKEINPDILIEPFTDLDKDMKFIYPLTGMFVNKEDINFKHVHKIIVKRKKMNKNMLFRILFLLGLTAGIILYTEKLTMDNIAHQNEINALETYVTKKQEAKEQEEALIEQSITVSRAIVQYAWVMESVENYRRISPEMLEHIYDENVVIHNLTYGSSQGSMMLKGYGASKDEVGEYSSALRDKDYADSQHYSGYSVVQDDAKSTYAFQIESVWNKVENEVVLNEENE